MIRQSNKPHQFQIEEFREINDLNLRHIFIDGEWYALPSHPIKREVCETLGLWVPDEEPKGNKCMISIDISDARPDGLPISITRPTGVPLPSSHKGWRLIDAQLMAHMSGGQVVNLWVSEGHRIVVNSDAGLLFGALLPMSPMTPIRSNG